MLARALVFTTSVTAVVILTSCDPGPDPLDEICDGALSARDVLDRVAPEYAATLTYHDRIGSTPLVIRSSYDGGAITCENHVDAPFPRPSLAASVTVEIRMEFSTADGAFHESFVGTLSGFRDTMVAWQSPIFRAGDLQGTWDPELPGYQDVSFDFHGNFDAATTTGYLVKRGQEPGHVPSAWPSAATWRN